MPNVYVLAGPDDHWLTPVVVQTQEVAFFTCKVSGYRVELINFQY